MNTRIFVERRADFDVESAKLYKDLKTAAPALQSAKVYQIYDIFGISSEELEAVKFTTFADPVTDILHTENPLKNPVIAMEFLPGQYDQRADAAEQCIALLTGNTGATVRSGKAVELQGATEAELKEIRHYLINAVERQEKNLAELQIPQEGEPAPVKAHEGFINFNEEQLQNFYKKNGFSFGLDDMQHIQQYFISEQRNPTETELKVLDTYWSDHCRHTTFETALTDIKFTGQYKETLERIFTDYQEKRRFLGRENRAVSLMDLGTIAAKYFHKKGQLDDLVISDEINACTIEVEAKYDGKTEPWYLLFKNETHNHPTEIEPYGGASTCLGGAIRDPLSGRAYVYQAMRVSGAANVLEPVSETIPGKLPQKVITKGAADGFSSYGNQIGVASTIISEFYHEGYKAKRLETGFVVGAVPKDWVKREKPLAGDIVMVFGGYTGRDGVGGATGSSKEQNEDSILTLSTEVQKGNPVTERKMQRLMRNPEFTKLIKKSNDFGAGGVSVAIGEIAESIDINLDSMPLKYGGLNGTELAISESQERMAAVISAKDKEKFLHLCESENLHAFEIGKVTDSGRMRMHWQGRTIVDISREFLNTNGCAKAQTAEVSHLEEITENHIEFNEKNFIAELSAMNNASQKGLVEMFDSSVGGTTVAMPFGGRYQETMMEGSVHTLPVLNAEDVETVSLAAWGFDPDLSARNSLIGAANAVVESVAKIVAMGGDYQKIRLSFQEYFEKLGTEPAKWGKPLASLLGAYDAQMNLELAAIGGKDSMSGTFQDLNVPPTLISFACAPGEKSSIISPEFKEPGNKIYLFEHTPQPNGLPDYDALKQVFRLINGNIKSGKIVSAKTVKGGGVAVALAKMSFGNKNGASIQYDDTKLLKKNIGSIIFESRENIDSNLIEPIGEVINGNYLKINDLDFDISKLLQAYKSTFADLFPFKETDPKIVEVESSFALKNEIPQRKSFKISKPSVFLPIFPGTNCEYETINAFRKEGALVSNSVFKSLNNSQIKESIDEWARQISKSQIIVFSGGFSNGDEPDGSAKFMVNVLKNERIKNAVHELLERDGLILGICNGFQALIKSGLVPFGEIRDLDENAPTLTNNKIGRHISQMVNVKVVSEESPWLNGMKDQIFTIPISHGEGRFVASESVIEQLYRKGQIATQYVDFEGNIAHGMPHNPNASLFGIEGITSECGKIYGRMGHGERFSEGLMKNIPDANYHNIFRNGVEYFRS